MPSTRTIPKRDHLVRVVWRVRPEALEQSFTAIVVDVREPGAGPFIRKPGKRFQVTPVLDLPGRAGWYSINEIKVVGWSPYELSATALGLLIGLDAIAAVQAKVLGYEPEYPARLSGQVNRLVKRGLVERHDAPRGRIGVSITEAGSATVQAWMQGRS
jgi:hypothetical protein